MEMAVFILEVSPNSYRRSIHDSGRSVTGVLDSQNAASFSKLGPGMGRGKVRCTIFISWGHGAPQSPHRTFTRSIRQ